MNYLILLDYSGAPFIGELKVDDATPADITEIKIHNSDNFGFANGALLALLTVGSIIGLYRGINLDWSYFEVTVAPVPTGSYQTIGINWVAGAANNFGDGDTVRFAPVALKGA